MENTEKMPITYEVLKQELKDSGRPYDFDMIDRAFALADQAHSGQRRRSGEPYICHPLSVAQILIDLGMDSESIAAALMHDVAEDTDVTIDEIRSKFGPEVALLVDGVTKLTQIKFSNVEDRQAENLRKMLLAMSQDVRVMIIKLSDRLHNMRTGDAWPEQKRRDKALETMEVYAPIAHRLGISNIKEELEDRSLQYLDPVGYNDHPAICWTNTATKFLHGVCDTISGRIWTENGIRERKDQIAASRVSTAFTARCICRTRSSRKSTTSMRYGSSWTRVAECYTALGLIHDMYHPLPNRFKDYISTPKPNGYQIAAHHRASAMRRMPFEVQIRTWEMHRTGGIRHRCALEIQGGHYRFQRQAGGAPCLGAAAAGEPAGLQRRCHRSAAATSRAICCRRKSLPSPPGAMSSICRRARRSSTLPMPFTRRWATG